MQVIKIKLLQLLCLFSPSVAYAAGDSIVIDISKRGNDISPTLFGIFYEEINPVMVVYMVSL